MSATKRAAVAALALLAGTAGWADRGSIPFIPYVKIFEPKQRAMIAWNGTEEILLLSTDLRASAATKVLEVLPLPSEPTVKKGSLDTFVTARRIINKHLALLYARRRRARGGTSLGMAQKAPPAGEVTFHKKIGPHDVSVTRVLRGDGFVDWVEKYLNKQGVEKVVIDDKLKAIVEEYIRDKFQWFVFDVVEVGIELKSLEPIQYRFKTDSLFYPLRITMLEEGRTTIELLVLTRKPLSKFPALPMKRVKLKHPLIRISDTELRTISRDMRDLLRRRHSHVLRVWELSGPLASFDRDLIAR